MRLGVGSGISWSRTIWRDRLEDASSILRRRIAAVRIMKAGAAIRLDGQEIVRGNYYNQWLKAAQLPRDDRYAQRLSQEHPFMDETALEWGLFDQRSFYQAFAEFDNQDIDASLVSENLLVRIMALLDRRVGKRRLVAMRASMQTAPPILRFFYALRLEAEGIGWND